MRVAGSATGGFQMVCDDAAARDGWWRALAACVAATRALARKRTIVSGYVVNDLDDGATLTEQFADVRRGVPGSFVDSSLDSIARRHAIAAASSRCLIRAGRHHHLLW